MEKHYTQYEKACYLILVTFLMMSPLMLSASFFNYADRIDSFQLSYNHNELRLPGESFILTVTVFYKNGKIKSSSDESVFNFIWNRFNVEVNGGEFAGGRVYVNHRLSPSKGKYIALKVYPRKLPKMAKQLLLPLNYEADIRLIPNGKIVKAPGFGFRFNIELTFDNGQHRVFAYSRINKLNDRFNFAVNGGELIRGKFIINNDFRNIDKHLVHITVMSKNNPECVYDYSLQLDYRADYHLAYNGSSGYNGFDGSDGSDGCSGSNGTNGSMGSNGGYGEPGPDVEVWVDQYFDSILGTQLMYIYARNIWTGHENFYLINPDGGRFFVSSSGGRGGDGGDGGNGGNGGKGNDGARHTKEHAVNDSITEIITYYDRGQNGGHGGSGAPGGYGGHGGDGGNIFIYITNDALSNSELIIPDSSGGWSGNGGFGGSGGSGGNGGFGSPSGSAGHSGSSGWSGHSGSRGWSGNVFYDVTDDLVF